MQDPNPDREELFIAHMLKYGSMNRVWDEPPHAHVEWMRTTYGKNWTQRFAFEGVYSLCVAMESWYIKNAQP